MELMSPAEPLGPPLTARLELAYYDFRCHHLRWKVPYRPYPQWLHLSSTKVPTPNRYVMAIWDVGHWHYCSNWFTILEKSSSHACDYSVTSLSGLNLSYSRRSKPLMLLHSSSTTSTNLGYPGKSYTITTYVR